MDNKSYGQLLLIQAMINVSRENTDDKIKNLTENLTAMITSMMDQIKISKHSPEKKDSSKAQDSTTALPDNKRYPPLERVNYTKRWHVEYKT